MGAVEKPARQRNEIFERPTALPRQLGRPLAPRLAELNPERRRTRAAAKANNPRQRPLVRIGIEAEAAMTDAARRFDRRLLDDDKRRARQRQRAQMLEMPVIRRPALGAVLAQEEVGIGGVRLGDRMTD